MASDLYGLEASGLPPELAAKYAGYNQQQQIAKALMQQGMAPIENSGGPGSRIHWTQGLAKIVNAYLGAKGMRDVNEGMAGLGQEAQAGKTAAFDAYQKMKTGTPEVAYNDTLGSEAPQAPVSPGMKADPRGAIAQALSNKYIQNSPLLKWDMDNLNRTESREDQQAFLKEQKQATLAQQEMLAKQAREQQMEALKMRLEDQRLSRQERAQAQQDLARLAAELRPPRPEPAPAQGTIVDPTNPKQMILIDARAYKGGGLGSPGVIGVAGKEPVAAKQAEAVDVGREGVTNVAEELRGYYDKLDQSGGITNPEKGTVGNLLAGIRSSTAGQAGGRILGTQDQSYRNSIAQARPLLMQAIMKATGMTSKQLDSNAELKLWLATATDPSLDVKANKAALDRIEKMYGMGAKKAAPGGIREVDW